MVLRDEPLKAPGLPGPFAEDRLDLRGQARPITAPCRVGDRPPLHLNADCDILDDEQAIALSLVTDDLRGGARCAQGGSAPPLSGGVVPEIRVGRRCPEGPGHGGKGRCLGDISTRALVAFPRFAVGLEGCLRDHAEGVRSDLAASHEIVAGRGPGEGCPRERIDASQERADSCDRIPRVIESDAESAEHGFNPGRFQCGLVSEVGHGERCAFAGKDHEGRHRYAEGLDLLHCEVAALSLASHDDVASLVPEARDDAAVPYRRPWTDHLVRNSLYLILSSGLQAALGFAFWIITARLFSTAALKPASCSSRSTPSTSPSTAACPQ